MKATPAKAHTASQSMQPHKYARLDSLRWLAAFAVGMGHSFQSFHYARPHKSPAHFLGTTLFNGAYAVDLFFVLSGFVLLNAIDELNFPSYLGYLARRFLRIYPAAWSSLILAWGTLVVLHPGADLQPTLCSHWILHIINPPDFFQSDVGP